MSSQDFLDWMAKAGCRSAADIVRTLDIGRNQAQRLVASAEAGEPIAVKRTVALAMAAVVHNLEPWGKE